MSAFIFKYFRSTQELIELKTAMFLADPSLVHKMERTEVSNLTYGSTKYVC